MLLRHFSSVQQISWGDGVRSRFLTLSLKTAATMTKTTTAHCLLLAVVLAALLTASEGIVRRCYSCRSRGRLGDCKDPVHFNATRLMKGVEAVPCASGWCSKIIEGKKNGEDHDLATERQCLQRSPPDGIQRCSEALIGVKKVFICFCRGDLCNSATSNTPSLLLLLLCPAVLLMLLTPHSL